MSGTFRVERLLAQSARFALHHRLDLVTAGVPLRLGAVAGSGGFGSVVVVDAIDAVGSAPSRPILAKLFDEDAVAAVSGGAGRISDGIAVLLHRLEGRSDESWCDDLLALPYCVMLGDWQGRRTLAALMLDLRALGYRAAPLGDSAAMAKYLASSLDERMELATAFARKAALLEDVGLVHGDLNGQNLLVRDAPPDVQVIDVDAGVLVVRGDERPLTPGKTDGLMPPEVKDPSAPGQIDMTAYLPASERWSVGCLIGYLLFGAHPAFFLAEISAASIRAYANERPGWPEIDPRSSLFTREPQNRTAYPAMRALFVSVPQVVVLSFRELFAAGLDATRRPPAAEWVRALAAMATPPVFDDVVLDGTCVFAGMPVTLAWRSDGASRVEIHIVEAVGRVVRLGDFPATGSVDVRLERRSGFVVVARNPHGDAYAAVGPVRVLPEPRPVSRPPRPPLTPPVPYALAQSIPKRHLEVIR